MHIHIYVMRKAVGIASTLMRLYKIFSDMQRPHLAHRWPKIALDLNLPQLALWQWLQESCRWTQGDLSIVGCHLTVYADVYADFAPKQTET